MGLALLASAGQWLSVAFRDCVLGLLALSCLVLWALLLAIWRGKGTAQFLLPKGRKGFQVEVFQGWFLESRSDFSGFSRTRGLL